MPNLRGYFNNIFWLVATYLLSPFFYPFILLKKKQTQPAKILVVSPARVGDLTCITPVFREIKKKFPACLLTVITAPDSQDLLANNHHIDEIISIADYGSIGRKVALINQLRKQGYDWAITTSPINVFINVIGFWALIPGRVITIYNDLGELHRLTVIFSNYRSEFKKNTMVLRHCLDLLKFIGAKGYSEKKEIFITPKEEASVRNFFQEHGFRDDDLLIGISAFSAVALNEWLPDRYAQLADQLIERLHAKIIFIGSDGERQRVELVQKMMKHASVNSCGKFRLRELPALIKQFKLFISGDTGPLYVADAVNTPVVAIFGPNNANEQAPLGKYYRILKKDIYCVPCSSIFLGASICKEGHLRCLTEITVEEVFAAARDLIKAIENDKKD